MAQNGFLAARITTSRGSLPLEGAVVTAIDTSNGTQSIIGKRTTDRNGQIPLITISAPDEILSQSPGNGQVYREVDVRVDKPLYYTVVIKKVQIFAGQTTIVEPALIPLIENESYDKRSDEFVQTPQNL